MTFSCIRRSIHSGRRIRVTGILTTVCALLFATAIQAAELSVGDFKFDGPLGSDGATIKKVAANHFKVTLGHAPEHPDWCNMLYFNIVRHARGTRCGWMFVSRGGIHTASTTTRVPGRTMRRTGRLSSGRRTPRTRRPAIPWSLGVCRGYGLFWRPGAALVRDRGRVDGQLEKHPHAEVQVLGKSLGGREILRLVITDPTSRFRWNPAGDTTSPISTPANTTRNGGWRGWSIGS